MTTFTAKLFTSSEWAETEIEAATPAEALEKAQELFDDQPEELWFEQYEDLSPLREVRILDAESKTLFIWASRNARLQETAPTLLEAAKAVVRNWENGALASTVRQLAVAIELADAPSEQGPASA
jgi:hypothetical protein